VENESKLPPLANVPVVCIEDVLAHPERALVIDLRSPGEYREDHVPGALNVPLLDDAGRALVGFAYTQVSPRAGFERGQALIEGRIAELVQEVAGLADWIAPSLDPACIVRAAASKGLEQLDAVVAPKAVCSLQEGAVVLHCWRGGLRSRSVVGLLRALGLDRAVGLEGGYKSYRTRVMGELNEWSCPKAHVLRGLTGVGKTLVLHEIERLRPGWTLDLEGCAGHRSSLLGMVGLDPVSQKTFESRMAARLRQRPEGPLVLEGESRRVGDAVIPAAVWKVLQGGENLVLRAEMPRRISVLSTDYLAQPEALPKLREQLVQVEKRMQGTWDLPGLLDGGRIDELVSVLLTDYYDPLYLHSEAGRDYACEIDAGDALQAAQDVIAWIEASMETTKINHD
jgi:tRNA 2-selenouridine synthase